jgi:hypothetical protein
LRLLDYISSCRSVVRPPGPAHCIRIEEIDRSNTMKAQFIAGLALSAVSAFAATSAFADGGIGHAGTYVAPTTVGQSGKTRAEVRAEITDSYNNGTLPALNRNSYPNRSLTGDVIASRHAQDAAVAEARNREIVGYANGSSTQAGSASVR